MINFMMPHYMAALRLIYQEISLAQAKKAAGGDAAQEIRDKDRIAQNFKMITKSAQDWGLPTVSDRTNRILSACRHHEILTFGETERHMLALLEAFEDDTKLLYFYVYPRDKAKVFTQVGNEWSAALAAFPSVASDIHHAADLYALGHNLSCVFQLMRIMETGVQHFGKKLGVSLTKRKPDRLADLTWHQILNDLNPKLKAISQKTVAGKAKFEKYSAIQSYLYGVKDAWRNPTMHPKKSGYSDPETSNLLIHVCAFMNELASVVSPEPTKKAAKSSLHKTTRPTPSIASFGLSR